MKAIALVLAATLAAACASHHPDSDGDVAVEAAAVPRVRPFLMFKDGVAQEAMDFYVSLFKGGRIVRADPYGPDDTGVEGTIKVGMFEIAGQRVMCTDASPAPPFDFTPLFSLWIECEDQDEIERLFATLEEGGMAMMPLGDYGFSETFGFVQDRYGVSWQLSLGTY